MADIETTTAQTNDTVEESVAEENATEKAQVGTESQDSTSQGATETTEQTKQVQSKEENAKFAQQRRQQEQQKAIEEAVNKERATHEQEKNELIRSLIKTNPYDNTALETAEDVERYLLMKDIDDGGGDPLKDFAKQYQAKERQKQAQAEAQARRDEKIQTDLAEFHNEYPNVSVNEVLNNKRFRAFYNGKDGETTLAQAYGDYLALINEIREEEKTKIVSEVAKSKSGVGSLNGGNNTPTMTREKLFNMSYAQQEAFKKSNPGLYRQLTS